MTRQRSADDRRGAVAPFMALCMFVLLGVMALTLDGGMMMYHRQRCRAVADAAALAAAEMLYLHYPSNDARQAAIAVAAAGGYANDGVDSAVTVNIPPVRTSHGQAGLRRSHPPVQSAAVLQRDLGGRPTPADESGRRPRPVDLLRQRHHRVGPTMPSALSLTGGGTVTVTNASVIVDSTNPQAATSASGSVATATEFDITGGYGTTNGGSFIGSVFTNSPPVPDPLAYLPPPDPSTLTVQSTKKLTITKDTALLPGVYTGGIAISGNANVTFAPGIYYMDTGGFSYGDGGSTGGSLTGTGVMIYNAPAPNSNSDVIAIKGNPSSTINLSPPTTGLYQGVSLFQERTSTQALSISGNENFAISGTFYAAKANLSVAGNGVSSTIGSQYISNSLTVSGGGAFNVSWTQNTTARTRIIGLVE